MAIKDKLVRKIPSLHKISMITLNLQDPKRHKENKPVTMHP